MPEQPIVKTASSKGLAIFLLVGGMVFCIPAIYLISTGLKTEYPQIAPIILGGFFGTFGLICIGYVYFLGPVEIYSDRLVKNSISGSPVKTILFSDITKWEEIKAENDVKQLTVYTEQTKYKITTYENGYEKIKKYLSEGNIKGAATLDSSVGAKNKQEEMGKKVSAILAFVLIVMGAWLT